MKEKGLSQAIQHCHTRVERSTRMLEEHLDTASVRTESSLFYG